MASVALPYSVNDVGGIGQRKKVSEPCQKLELTMPEKLNSLA